MRKFEKVSRDVFEIDVPDGNYDELILPKRGTKYSAGYDFYSPIDFILMPGERKVIPTGIKVCMEENEGHIFVCLKNEGDKEVNINKGDRFVQGIFTPYLITDDDSATGNREGGIGSTNKGDDNNE